MLPEEKICKNNYSPRGLDIPATIKQSKVSLPTLRRVSEWTCSRGLNFKHKTNMTEIKKFKVQIVPQSRKELNFANDNGFKYQPGENIGDKGCYIKECSFREKKALENDYATLQNQMPAKVLSELTFSQGKYSQPGSCSLSLEITCKHEGGIDKQTITIEGHDHSQCRYLLANILDGYIEEMKKWTGILRASSVNAFCIDNIKSNTKQT